MKEAIEDLEWPGGGGVEIVMEKDPQRLYITASGTGKMTVELPVQELSGFQCSSESVRHLYKCVVVQPEGS